MAITISSPLVRSPDMAVLSKILNPDVSLAVWDRSRPHTLLDGMAGLCPAHLPQGRVLVWLPDAPSALSGILAETPIAATALGRALRDDILMLVRRFAVIADTDIVDIRLDRLRHDACWKFHRDQVRLRLLATYRGPATQIVPQVQAEEALRDQQLYHGPLEEFPDGAVALFKGTQAGPVGGVVHRSPPIAGTGTVRSLLCLNLPSDTSPRLWEP
ncbi:DUF1826 domain-containing protein [Niveispirillum sp.]|uniref:DUF1826 domain-containing protein n=1 Tax=Niveispirillum sp. TaxID=1917217 RepID=UPI001B63FF21|nr:DUF1826 domain-containing protein [Niveispirillum sp.]MBP7337225.1 DUF1826 domain-containing protein [Niveispirillum sp.]